jgi:hypothetical protein
MKWYLTVYICTEKILAKAIGYLLCLGDGDFNRMSEMFAQVNFTCDHRQK